MRRPVDAEPCLAVRRQLDNWLDLGEAGRSALRAHADTCTACARSVAAAERVEQVLADGVASYAALRPHGTFDDLLARQRARRPRTMMRDFWRGRWWSGAPMAPRLSTLAGAVVAVGLSVAWLVLSTGRTPPVDTLPRPGASQGALSASPSTPASLSSTLSSLGRQVRGARLVQPQAPAGGWRPTLPSSPKRPSVLPRPGKPRPSGRTE